VRNLRTDWLGAAIVNKHVTSLLTYCKTIPKPFTQLKIRYLRRKLPLLESEMIMDQKLGLMLISLNALDRDR
jgi:hypothetical protein